MTDVVEVIRVHTPRAGVYVDYDVTLSIAVEEGVLWIFDEDTCVVGIHPAGGWTSAERVEV